MVFILPWAVPGIPSFMSIHWMLNGQWGLINNIIWELYRVDGPLAGSSQLRAGRRDLHLGGAQQ